MTSHDSISEALDAMDGPTGAVEVDLPDGKGVLDVREVGALGVTVGEVRVRRNQPYELETAAQEVAKRVRSLRDRVVPVEVDTRLGGGVLRSRPEDMRGTDFYQVDLEGDREVRVRRFGPEKGGGRKVLDFTLTREQLGDLVDELS